jgi:Cu(I)/Ag(I) efflux system membrane protein CusA/SilA
MFGLLPIMWSTGTGADLMKRVAAPMVGGLVTSFILELLVYPAIYFLWRKRQLPTTHANFARGVADAQALPRSPDVA